jgi:hypothetical protein
MHENKKNLRILRELMSLGSHKIKSRVTAIERQRAPQSEYAGFFSLFGGALRIHRALQRRQRFLTAPLFSKANGFFRCKS